MVIRNEVIFSKNGKKKFFGPVHICLANKPLSANIHFEIKEFFRYCSLLEKSKQEKELKEFKKELARCSKFHWKIDYYDGVKYTGGMAILSCLAPHRHSIEDGSKNIHIWKKFDIVSINSKGYVFNKTKVPRRMLSNIPRISITLDQMAFLKFRLACLRAVRSLKSRS